MLGSGEGVAREELGRGREGSAVVQSERAVVFCGFLLYIPLFCIVVVTVPLVCCSVKLPLSRPTSFLTVYFHSPPHPGGGRGGRVTLFLPAAAERRTAKNKLCNFVLGYEV